MAKYKLEYIWLDGYTPVPNLRGKTLVKEYGAFPKLEELPPWGFDGSSTQQAEGKNSDCFLKPVAVFPDSTRKNGALVSDRTGQVSAYALFHLEARGRLFVAPGDDVYEGQVVGEHNRESDLDVNITKEKKLTNVRSKNKDENTLLTPPIQHTIETAMEFIDRDELVEITPDAIRIRKKVLAINLRPKRSDNS